jgi:hypothetical protein
MVLSALVLALVVMYPAAVLVLAVILTALNVQPLKLLNA